MYHRALTIRLMSLCVTVGVLWGQVGGTSRFTTQGTTPPAVAPGTPEGSYSLSGFDSINPYSRKLNISIPMLTVGGRGEAGYTMFLNLDQQWQVRTYTDCTNGANCVYLQTPIPDWWSTSEVGYGPGTLLGRYAPFDSVSCPSGAQTQDLLTRFTLTESNGSEHELVDDSTKGKPFKGIEASNGNCTYFGTNQRGPTFVSRNGQAMTFTANQTYSETSSVPPSRPDSLPAIEPNGDLYMADGRAYKVVLGLVNQIKDRHGNKVSFVYDSNRRITQINEPNRIITVTYAYPLGAACDVALGGGQEATYPCDKISYPGLGGQPRVIRVYYATLSQTGVATQTNIDLFIGNAINIDTVPAPVLFNPAVPVAMRTINDRLYRFTYNKFGYVTEVTLPTGGKTQYTNNILAFTQGSSATILNQVEGRREIDELGVLRRRTTYGPTNLFGTGNQNTSRITTDFDPANNVLRKTSSRFFSNMFSVFPGYPVAYTGREYQSDVYLPGATDAEVNAANTATIAKILRRTDTAWISTPTTGGVPDLDARVQTQTTYLERLTKTSIVQFGYDQYNNITTQNWYDFDGSIKRTRNTLYKTDYASAPVHLRRLPVDETVSGPAGQESHSTYAYDETARTGNIPPSANFEAPAGSQRGNPTTIEQYLVTTAAKVT